MRKYKLNLAYKLMIPIATLLFITFGIGAYWAYQSQLMVLEEDNIDALVESEERFSELQSQDTNMLASTLRVLTQNEQIKDIYLKKDRDLLYEYNEDLFNQLKESFSITHWYFIGLDDKVFLRMHDKENSGDVVKRATFLKSKETGGVGSGIELGKTAFALRVVVPYYDGDKLIGYMELGQEIDAFLGTMSKDTGATYSLVVQKDHLSKESWALVREKAGLTNNWNDIKDYVVISGNATEHSKEANAITSYISKISTDENNLDTNKGILGAYKEGGRMYSVGRFGIKDATGTGAGMIYFSLDNTDQVVQNNNTILRIMALILALAVSFFGVLYLFLRKVVISPLKKIQAEISSLKINGYKYSLKLKSNDEIGSLNQEVSKMAETVKEKTNNLEKEVDLKTKTLQKKLAQIEKTNRVMIGRELRMIELKKQLAQKKKDIDEN